MPARPMPTTIAPMMIALVRLNGALRVRAHFLRDLDLRREQRTRRRSTASRNVGRAFSISALSALVERARLRGEQRFLHVAEHFVTRASRTARRISRSLSVSSVASSFVEQLLDVGLAFLAAGRSPAFTAAAS